MNNFRLINLIKTLTKSETHRFGLFLSSPYFNKQERLCQLWEFLMGFYPAFDASSLDKQAIFAAIFPKAKTFNEQQVHDHFSALNKLLRQFLAQETFQRDEDAGDRYLLRALKEKQQAKEVIRNYHHVKNRQKGRKADEQFFLHQYQIAAQADPVFTQERKRKDSDTLSESMDYLDQFFLVSKLKISCEMLNRAQIVNSHYRPEMLEQIDAYLQGEGSRHLDIPFLAVYYTIFHMLHGTDSDRQFEQLVLLLKEKALLFTKKEAYNAYAFALNFCVRRINAGKPSYLGSLFELYQQLLGQGILIGEDGFLPHEMAKNIVTVGLRLKQYDWVKQFLDDYHPKLHPRHRENAFTYNMASFYYEQGQYPKSLKLLRDVAFTDVFYALGARSLQFKMYYELEEDDSLLYLVKAFRTFLKRNKDISKGQFASYDNLLKLGQQAYRLKLKRGNMLPEVFQEKVKKLGQKMTQAGPIANLNWLKEKMAELDTPDH